MVSAVSLAGVLVLIALNTAIAAVAARFFRLQMATRWGAVVFTVLAVPLLYVVTTLVLGGFLGAGVFADRGTLLVFTWALPFSLGYSIDLFWMPPPEDVELPSRT